MPIAPAVDETLTSSEPVRPSTCNLCGEGPMGPSRRYVYRTGGRSFGAALLAASVTALAFLVLSAVVEDTPYLFGLRREVLALIIVPFLAAGAFMWRWRTVWRCTRCGSRARL